MRSLAFFSAPWTVLMRVHGAIPRALADDLTTLTVGDSAMVSTVAALPNAFEYLNAMGGKVRIQKTWSFASCTTIRTQLAMVKSKWQKEINLEVAQAQRPWWAPRFHKEAHGDDSHTNNDRCHNQCM